MGVDLKLLVVRQDGINTGYAHTMLPFGRHYDAFKALNRFTKTFQNFELSCHVASDPVTGKTCYGVVKTTPYGSKLSYISVKDFLKATSDFKFTDSEQRAAIAYLKERDPKTLIALYYY